MVQKRIGIGTFGRVFKVLDIQTKENFAIKIQKKLPDKRKLLLLQKEAEIVRDLSNELGFPKLKIFFKENRKGFLVMSYLGENLANLYHTNNGRFSLKTVCMIALQLLSRIEVLHSKFYLHRDIKLENIVLGPNGDDKTLHLIDFGLSKSYLDEDGKHMKMRTDKGMVGTVRYSSIYTQQGLEQGRRDDLISIGYLLIFLLKEELPWQKVKIDYANLKEKEEKYKKVLEVKLQTSNQTLCENIPKQFLTYMNYVRSLEFEQEPNYKMLKGLFQETMIKFNYEMDWEFDWIKKSKPCTLSSFKQLDGKKALLNTLSSETIQNQKIKREMSGNTFNYAHCSISNLESMNKIELSHTNSFQSPFQSFIRKGISMSHYNSISYKKKRGLILMQEKYLMSQMV